MTLGTLKSDSDVAVQSDGKIVVAGSSQSNFVVARFNIDGSLDTTGFNNPNGYNIKDFSGGSDFPLAIAVQSDGKIVLAGYSGNDVALARFDGNGALDTASFGGGTGIVTLNLGGADEAYAMGLQSDDKIIVAGTGNNKFAIARFTIGGVLDTTFNPPDGYNLTDLGFSQGQKHLAIAIDTDDSIVAVGYGQNAPAEASMTIFRYLSDGTLDESFSNDGHEEVNLLNVAEIGQAVGLGSIVVGGSSADDVEAGNFILSRFGTHAAVAGTTGGATTSVSGPKELPETGFTPGRATKLPAQPASTQYATYDDIKLYIPQLNLSAPVVGVQQQGESWNVSWLGNDVGYLQGTAFPTLPGNTALAGHVTDADGNPGIFANLGELSYGDQIKILAWGQTYNYEVRSNTLIFPSNLSVLGHEDYDWLTLITCQGYDQTLSTYRLRRVVQAVLVNVQ